jgi:hypothetical protein
MGTGVHIRCLGERLSPTRATARPVLLVLLLAAAAGCRGQEPLTKQQYAARLSAACEDFAASETKIGDPTTLPDLVEKGPLILGAFEETILAEVRTLEAPNDLADHASRMVELAERQRDVLAALIDAARAGDFAKVRALASKNTAINEAAGAIARDLGAQGCDRT